MVTVHISIVDSNKITRTPVKVIVTNLNLKDTNNFFVRMMKRRYRINLFHMVNYYAVEDAFGDKLSLWSDFVILEHRGNDEPPSAGKHT